MKNKAKCLFVENEEFFQSFFFGNFFFEFLFNRIKIFSFVTHIRSLEFKKSKIYDISGRIFKSVHFVFVSVFHLKLLISNAFGDEQNYSVSRVENFGNNAATLLGYSHFLAVFQIPESHSGCFSIKIRKMVR